MSHLMIDIEGLASNPETCILTIAAQSFDPFGTGYADKHFYRRITIESQPDRTISQGTIDWWATQPKEAQDEAFGLEDRVPLDEALDELGKIIFHHKNIWSCGPTYDMCILENAYRSLDKHVPWPFYAVRDARTVFALWPDCPKPPTSHHALEDCRRQINMLQQTFKHLNIKEMR